MRALLALLVLCAGIYAAHAFGLGEGNRFGRLGAASKGGGGVVPPVGCAGAIDASAGCPLPMLGM